MDRHTARDQTYADRADQYNPFGSVQWTTQKVKDPATGKWVTKWIQQQSMSDQLGGIYNNSMDKNKGLSDLSAGMMDRVQQEMGAAPDWGQFGDVVGMDFDPTSIRQAAEDAAYQREAMRLDPRFQRSGEQLEIKLRNQGLRPGDEAYEAEMSRLNQEKNDAYERARLGATQQGRAESEMLWSQATQGNEMANALRDKQIQEYLAKRGFSLGEMESLDPTANLKGMSDVFTGGGGSAS